MITKDTLVEEAPIGEMPAREGSGGAIVIGGDYRGLGIVRSLGRQGIPVWVLTDQHRLAATSRYASRSLSWPGGNSVRQLQFLLDLAKHQRLDGWALFPTGDETAALIARNQATLSKRFQLTTPSWQVMEPAYDKRLTHRLAEKWGVDHPWTYCPASREELTRLDCSFPVILKPAIKEGFNSFVHAKAWRVNSHRELLERYDDAARLVDPSLIMVQEMIPGDGGTQFSYAALCSEGRPVASVTACRIRQYPVDFGRSSSYVETTENAAVERASRRLLSAICFTGLVEVEFKRDQRDGRYKLLDINPRIWGWHSVGKRAGVDFPYLLWKMIHGEQVAEIRGRPGVRWVRMTTDLPSMVTEIRRGSLSAGDYLRSLQGPLEFAIFAGDDPLPALAEVPLLTHLSLSRGAV